MRNVLFLVCVIAIFTVGFVSAAHAHVDTQGADQQIKFSSGHDSADNGNAADPLGDMHCHNHIAPIDFVQADFPKFTNKLPAALAKSVTSSFIYGLKRPPRT